MPTFNVLLKYMVQNMFFNHIYKYVCIYIYILYYILHMFHLVDFDFERTDILPYHITYLNKLLIITFKSR